MHPCVAWHNLISSSPPLVFPSLGRWLTSSSPGSHIWFLLVDPRMKFLLSLPSFHPQETQAGL